MISYIHGELAGVEKDKAIIDVHGVGYGIFMPGRCLANLPPKGREVKVFTHMNIREDAAQLFGFLSKDDLEVFRLVITVSGIGPKGGLSILSVLSADELKSAVVTGDTKAITAAPGIGRKTAEKLILELKDRFDIEDVLSGADDGGAGAFTVEAGPGGAKGEALAALVALGYGYAESLKAVKGVTDENLPVEKILKEALRNIF